MSYYDAESNPTVEDEEKMEPPTSPSSSYNYVVSEIFSDEDILADLQFDPRESNDHEDDIEQTTLGQHEFNPTFYRDHSDSSIVDIESELKWTIEETEKQLKKNKRRLFCSCAMLLKLILAALGWATLSHHMSKSGNKNLTSSDPTEPPVVCIDEVVVPKSCYTFGEPIELHFHYCSPDPKNWLGLYREGSSDENGTMVQRSLYWQLPCGGHGDSCVNPTEYGNITMTPTLGIGTYQVYEMGDMELPHVSKAASETFVVRMKCE